MPKGGKRRVLFDWAWRLTLRARGVRVGVGLRGVRLRGLGWGLGPRRGPILWHVPGAPGTPGPAPRSPASTCRGPVAPWSGRCRPTCDHQPHKTRVTDRRHTSSCFLSLFYFYYWLSLLLVKSVVKVSLSPQHSLKIFLWRLKCSCLVLLTISVEEEEEEEEIKKKREIDRRLHAKVALTKNMWSIYNVGNIDYDSIVFF